jgi:hypothetical protein
MTGYLARVKTLLAENPLPEQPTELTEGASVSSVSDHGSHVFEGEGAFVSLVSGRSRHLSNDGEGRCFVCGQPARFGLGVHLRRGLEGRWTCAVHRPQGEGHA